MTDSTVPEVLEQVTARAYDLYAPSATVGVPRIVPAAWHSIKPTRKGGNVDTIEPKVTFNMDLANGRTSLRFCYEASAVLADDGHIYADATAQLEGMTDDDEWMWETVEEWSNRLFDAGYYVMWDAGDVVVFDLRPFTDDERESFFDTMAY